jgi:predicted permease
VLSLSQTIQGLHWDRVPGDNDNEVGARGILYLLIFQQLGQLVRWTWGYNVLLAPPDTYDESEGGTRNLIEEGSFEPYDNEDAGESSDTQGPGSDDSPTTSQSQYASGSHTPVTHQQYTDSVSSRASSAKGKKGKPDALLPTPANGNVKPYTDDVEGREDVEEDEQYERVIASGWKGYKARTTRSIRRVMHMVSSSISLTSSKAFQSMPGPVQTTFSFIYRSLRRFFLGVWEFMNPPLWAMLIAILVASVPRLQALFFEKGTFVNNSITHAVTQSGGVAVPLILVVLGANLARNTLPKDQTMNENPKEERNLLIAALVSRMLLPTIIMAPILAVTAKYVPISILDDPIFIIVCFLLTGAPSALQLAQICQLNNVYMGAMSKLLFQSYVVWYVLLTQTFTVFHANQAIGFFHLRWFWSCSHSRLWSGLQWPRRG